jgi:hypothetical protein
MLAREIFILTVRSNINGLLIIKWVDAKGKEVDLEKIPHEEKLESFETSSATNGNWVCATTIFVFSTQKGS